MPELLNPAGLAWLTLLPLLLVPYLLRQQPRRRVVAALFLYDGIEPAQRVRLGGRVRIRPLFFLQLLLLLLAIAALARPAWRSPEVRAALVLDNSASLQTVEDSGETRFAAAERAAQSAIAADPADTWDLFVLSPMPRELGVGLSPREARSRISAVAAASCSHPDDTLLRSFFERLAGSDYASIHVVTDRPARSTDHFRVTTVGRPAPNVAITDATLLPPAVAGQPASLNAVVENFSPHPVTVPIRILDSAGAAVRDGKLALPAHGSASFTAEVPATGRFQARIETRDPLPVDDELPVSADTIGSGNVLLVSPDAGGLGALEKILGMHLEVVTPERYRPELAERRDLVIFHLSAPTEPPAVPALYLLPPEAAFLPPTTGRVDAPPIAFPRPTHPAARYLNAAALRPRRVLTLGEPTGWQAIALASGGPVIVERTVPTRAVVSGIDLLPYLGDRNRPISILTLNLLSWMLHSPAANDAARGGRCMPISRAESNLERPLDLPPLPPRRGHAETSARSQPLWPALTLAALALLLLDAWLERGGGALVWALRLLAAAIVVAAWVDPVRVIAAPTPPPLVLVDASASVLAPARQRDLAEIEKTVSASAPAIVFAAGRTRSTLSALDGAVRSADASATDIEAALYEAAGDAFAGGRPVFLLTDGWENRGDTRRVLDLVKERAVRIYPIAASQQLGDDVEVSSLSIPAETPAGKAVRAEVLLRNDNLSPVSGRLTIRRGGSELVRENVKLPPGESIVARPLLITGNGLVELAAEFQPAAPATDTERDNNLAKAWVAVGGGQKILIVGHDPRDNQSLVQTLSQRGFRVTSVARGDGEALPDPTGFAAVVLNDVPAADLPGGTPERLREYVRSGGGLAMIGGPRSFGLGGYRGSPIEEALPVRMKERRRDEPRNAVALVIDKSGSMREEQRIAFAREAARQLVEHLKERDRLAVIGFDREAFVIVPLAEVGEIRDDFERRIDRLKPSGGTRLYPALEEARRQLLGEQAKRRHIIVLSDGLNEDAETAAGRRQYYDLALALAEQGVTISTVALGREADADFLERLASFGRGAFHATIDASSLPEIVLGEFEEHGREKTLSEREYRPLPSRESPLVGRLARAEARWPSVLGLVETELKAQARRDVGVSESDAPLIASWEYGRGRAAAITTDADGRWSDRWLRWKEWSRLWSDVASWLAPEARGQQSRFAVAYREGALEIDYSRFDQDPAGAVSARISTPEARSEEIPLQRIALGHYRGRLITAAPGDYRIEIDSAQGVVTQPALGYTIAKSLTGERPRREPNWPLLEEIARRTGGEVDPVLADVEPALAPEATRPLAPWLIPAAMLLFLLELVVRRLRQNM